MPAIYPTGFINEPLLAAQRMMVNCVAWRRWIDIASVEVAKGRTYIIGPLPPLDDTFSLSEQERIRPFAVIHPEPIGEYSAISRGQGAFAKRGNLVIRIEAEAAKGLVASLPHVIVDFRNKLGDVIADLLGLNDPTYLSIQKLDVQGMEYAEYGEQDTQGYYCRGELHIAWGP